MTDVGVPTWPVRPLQEVVDILDSRRVPVNQTERASRQGDVPYYGATGQVGWIDDHLFDEELVLLGEDGAPFFDRDRAKAYLISGRSWVNNHAHVLRGKPGVLLNRFLLHFLNTVDYGPYVSGTTRLKLPQGPLKTIGVPVPPVDEQARIVARIEELLSDVDAGEIDRVRALDMLPALVDASLLVAFERAALSGPSVRLGDILKTTSGGTPDRKYAANYGGGIPWVKSGELNDSRVVRTEETITESGLAASSAKWVPAGSVLVAMYGATVGVLAHLDIPATTNQAVCAIHPDERVDADYLYWFLRSRRRHLIGLGKGGAQNNIGQGTIRDLVMPLPDRPVQEAIAAAVSDTMDAVAMLSRDASGIGRGVAGLRHAILKAAFSGQLT